MTNRQQPHPQRCLHSKMCVWNKGRPGECLDTDCASHRYVYASHSSETEPEHRSIDIVRMLAAVEQARKEERERVLDLLIPIFTPDNKRPDEMKCRNCDATIKAYLESLRGEQ